MVCFSYPEADEGRYFALFDAISLIPRALTALNTRLCTRAHQHAHAHGGKLRAKAEMGWSLLLAILKTTYNLLVTLKGVSHILFFSINELNE